MGGLPLDASVLRRGHTTVVPPWHTFLGSAPARLLCVCPQRAPLRPTTAHSHCLSCARASHTPREGSEAAEITAEITTFGHPGTTLLRVVRRPPSASCSLRGPTPTGSTPRFNPRMGSYALWERLIGLSQPVCLFFLAIINSEL